MHIKPSQIAAIRNYVPGPAYELWDEEASKTTAVYCISCGIYATTGHWFDKDTEGLSRTHKELTKTKKQCVSYCVECKLLLY